MSEAASDGQYTKLYSVRTTLLAMLADRGYLVADEEKNKSFADWKLDMQSQNNGREGTIPLTHVMKETPYIEDPSKLMLVFLPNEAKVGTSTIQKYVAALESKNTEPEGQASTSARAIIVIQDKLTAYANKTLNDTTKNKHRVEVFTENELLVNITNHVLVPKHIKLSLQEKQQLLERYKCKDTQLPRIRLDDPVSKYYGFERGDVVKIVRNSETSGTYVTYRLVS